MWLAFILTVIFWVTLLENTYMISFVLKVILKWFGKNIHHILEMCQIYFFKHNVVIHIYDYSIKDIKLGLTNFH